MSTHPLLDSMLRSRSDLSANDRANLLRHFNQMEGNAEFIAVYPSHEALHQAQERVYQFNEEVAPVIMWGHGGYEAGQPTSSQLYVYALVNEDQHHALGQLLQIGSTGVVLSGRIE